MASPNEKLAASLDLLNKVQRNGIVRLSDLSRTHRERLIKSGFLREVITRWFIVSNPAASDGASTSWYASFWSFLSQYLESRFGDDYCLAPEASIKRHIGANLIPRQIIVIVRENINQNLPLCFDTSLYIYHTKDSFPEERVKQDGIWLMDLPAALCRVGKTFFKNNPADAEIALRMIRDPSALLRILLQGGNTVIAGRLVGAYTYLGEPQTAQQIKETMDAAGNIIRSVTNPFDRDEPYLTARTRIVSPHTARIQSLWAAMRRSVQAEFPPIEGNTIDTAHYLAEVEERYAEDAYNSLSIEGYRVSAALIERVRSGDWNPNSSDADKVEANALAARGYYQAFQAVKGSIGKILNGAEPVGVVKQDYQGWYREMFMSAVNAGILKVDQLAGYRNSPVYLSGSRYVPPSSDAVPDCMETFLDLMDQETDAAVRAVLGHFIFVYIHPYSDGNGRIGRFLMNTMFASGRYPWTVIRQTRRDHYLAALEEASVNHNLRPFAQFVREEMLAPLESPNISVEVWNIGTSGQPLPFRYWMSRERASDLRKTFDASRQAGGPTEVLFYYDASGYDPEGWTNISGSRMADLRSMTDIKILEPTNPASYESSGFLRQISY
jgi:hypothetical protein